MSDEFKFDKSIAPSLELTRQRVANTQEGNAAIAPMGYFGNVWIRGQYYLKKGDSHLGHKHNYDHMTMVVTGSVEVYVGDDEPVLYVAPTFFEVPAEKEHNITAMDDGTSLFCVFAVRDKEGGGCI